MEESQEGSLGGRVVRGSVGGVLMGLANLVPGISGGTMLVASGIYTRFIDAVADVTRLRFSWRAVSTLAIVVGAAMLAILALAGTVRDLVVEHRWVMYSIFIGLTLGGVPVVARMAKPITAPVRWGAAIGFVLMAGLALLQQRGGGAGGGEVGFAMFFLAGVAGAAAMILPGVSGGYLLLVMGAYVPLLDAIDKFTGAARGKDYAAAMDVGLHSLLPVALGVGVGVAVVSNLLKYLLHHFEKATLGVLLGLLLGAVVGIWPFQEGVRPTPGTIVKGRKILTEEQIAEIAPKDWPTAFFSPEAWQIGAALGLIVVGFAVTALVARLAPDNE